MSLGRKATWICLAVLGLALAYGCFLVMQPFLGELFLALVLTIVFYPLYSWILSRTGRPTLSAWLSTIATGLLFLLPASALGIIVTQEMMRAMDAIGAAIGPSGELSWLDRGIAYVSDRFGANPAEVKEFVSSRFGMVSGSIVSNAVRSLQGIGEWIFSSVITLVSMFFMFSGGKRMLYESKSWVPLPPLVMESLFQETELQIFANVYGVVAVGIAQGLLTAIGFLICGLPSAWFWGTVAAILSVFPFIGAGIVWIPGVLYLAMTGGYTKAGILLAWGVLIVSMADNVIRPIVLSEKAQTNTAIMFFALLGGIDAFGLVGLFAGPLVFSLAIAVMKLLRQYSKDIASSIEGETVG